MTREVLIMGAVAAIAGLLGIALLAARAKSEASVYRRRIAGTMLVALSVVLFANAWAQHSWNLAP